MKATVAIIAFNAQPWIRPQLEALSRQQTDFEWEVLWLDSGSTDGTLEVVKDFDVRLHQIPNSEFGHGKTRNLAAQLANGEFVVYLTQDAIPAHDHWLEELLKPLEIDERVVCVYGQQIPQANCCPTVKRDVTNVFRSFGPDQFIMLQHDNPLVTDQAAKDSITFFSDANSAVRKSLLLGPIPYRDVAYSEDYALGRDVIAAGYYKAYAPLGAVIHSHSYPPMKYFRRMYDEMRGLKETTGQTLDSSISRHILIIGRQTLGDWRFILQDRSYSLPQKLKWLVQAPVYQLFRRVAIRLSTKKQLPGWAHGWLSLETRAKKSAQ